jgi:hypothetical protein
MDIVRPARLACFVPRADIGSLFDHVVGERQQVRWNIETKRLRGFEIDCDLEFTSAWAGRKSSIEMLSTDLPI